MGNSQKKEEGLSSKVKGRASMRRPRKSIYENADLK